MPLFYLLSALFTALALYAVFLLIGRSTHRHASGVPPGPRALPIIGNVHQLPTECLEQAFVLWAKKYGDPVFARFFRTPTLIISTQRVARDLLEKRGSIYNSRPRTVLFSEMMEWDSTAFLPYDSERRRKQRRWIQVMFNDQAALRSYDRIRQREMYKLLLALMQTPGNFVMHIKRFVAALLLEILYGHKVDSLDDPYFLLMDMATRGTADGGGAAALVDFFPILRFTPSWMPGAGFKRHALKMKEIIRQASHGPYEATKAAVLVGTATPSLIANLIEDAQRNGTFAEDERDIRTAAATSYSAGSDTTKGSLISFILAMVIYPDVFRKAQEEVDRVIGVDRLPQLEDRDKLPYVDCIISEVLRWSAPVPLGIPHCLTEDDVYEGYTIPKGSTVIANIWAMANDEELYPDPSTFRPERFLHMDAKAKGAVDPRATVFGFGRRICPGRYFADASLFVAIANIVATLNITKARGADGEEITPSTKFGSGLARHPPDFVCTITPRSQRVMDMVTEILVDVLD